MEAWRTEYSAAEKTRAEEFLNLNHQATELLTTFESQSNEAGERAANRVRARASNLVEEIQTIRREAGELAAAAGADSIARDYKGAAVAEGKSADTWRRIAMACMGIGIALVVWLLFVQPIISEAELSWIAVARATVLGAALSAPALYARAESARHRRLARRNQKFALDIDAIGPYLANLDESQRNAVRVELVGKMFAQPDTYEGPQVQDGAEAESLIEVIGRLLGVLEKKL